MRANVNDNMRRHCDACGIALNDNPYALLRDPASNGACCEGCARLGDEGTLLCDGCLKAVGYANLWAGVFGWPYDLTWHLDDMCAQRLWDVRWMPDRMTVAEAECWNEYERRRDRTLVNRDEWDPRAFHLRDPNTDPQLARAMTESLGLDYDRRTMRRFRQYHGIRWDETDADTARRLLGDA